jgi:hypothetical protein
VVGRETRRPREASAMDLVMDALYVGLTVLFFGLSWAFVKLCELV